MGIVVNPIVVAPDMFIGKLPVKVLGGTIRVKCYWIPLLEKLQYHMTQCSTLFIFQTIILRIVKLNNI